MHVVLVDPSLFTLPYDVALAAGLQDAGHEVVLHGRRPGPDDGQLGGVPLADTFYRVSGSQALSGMPRAVQLALKGIEHVFSMAALFRLLRRACPDVIHFQWLPLPLVDYPFIRRLRRIAPVVLTVHDTDPFNGNPAAQLQRRGVTSSYAAFDRLIVHTTQGRARLLREGVAEGRLAVLPHGLLGASAGNQRHCTAGAQQRPLTFLLFGKIKPYKGLDLLVEAFGGIAPDLAAGARVRVVGKPYMDLGPIEARIKQLGLDGKVVIEPGFIRDEDIPELFDQSTVAVFPYREIEASGVLALAIAHGRPILASRIGGFAETVADSVHGLLVEPGDVAALSAAMSRFLADQAFTAACGRAVQRLSNEIPSWQEIARLTVEVYQAAARHRATSLAAAGGTGYRQPKTPAKPAHDTRFDPQSGDEPKPAANRAK